MGRQTAVVAAMLLMVPNTNSCVSFRWAMSSYIVWKHQKTSPWGIESQNIQFN